MYIELSSEQLQELKWLLGGAAPQRSNAPGILKAVHINPQGALETLNDAIPGGDQQVRVIAFKRGSDNPKPNLLEVLLGALDVEGISPDDPAEPYPNQAVPVVKAGRTTQLGEPLPGEEFPDINDVLPELEDPTFSVSPIYLKNLLSGFAGQVDVIIPEETESYRGQKVKRVTTPICFRGKTKTGKYAYAVLMPMQTGN